MRRSELWRTTTIRLTLVYGAVFAAGVVALLGLIYWSAAGYLTRQMDLIVLGQARAIQAAPVGGLPERVRQSRAQDVRNVDFVGLYSPSGAWIAGNVPRLPPGARCTSTASSRGPGAWRNGCRPARSCSSAMTPRC